MRIKSYRSIEIWYRNRKLYCCPQALQFGQNFCAHRVRRPQKHRFTRLFRENMTKIIPQISIFRCRIQDTVVKELCSWSQSAFKTLTLNYTRITPIGRSRDPTEQPLHYDDEIVSLYQSGCHVTWEGHVTSSTSCIYIGTLITRANYLIEVSFHVYTAAQCMYNLHTLYNATLTMYKNQRKFLLFWLAPRQNFAKIDLIPKFRFFFSLSWVPIEAILSTGN